MRKYRKMTNLSTNKIGTASKRYLQLWFLFQEVSYRNYIYHLCTDTSLQVHPSAQLLRSNILWNLLMVDAIKWFMFEILFIYISYCKIKCQLNIHTCKMYVNIPSKQLRHQVQCLENKQDIRILPSLEWYQDHQVSYNLSVDRLFPLK